MLKVSIIIITFGHEKYNMTEWFKLTYKIDHFEVIDGAVYAIW